MKADRLSCHRFISNQFRLLLHAAAYWLMDALRRKLVCSGVRRMQLDSLRLDLIKIGGRVRELLTKVRLRLASGHPGQDLWHALSVAFRAVHEQSGLGDHVLRRSGGGPRPDLEITRNSSARCPFAPRSFVVLSDDG